MFFKYSLSQSLDIEQINSTIQMKNQEERRKKIVEEEVSKFTNKQTSQNKKLQEIYEKSLRDQAEAYQRKKNEDDNRILQEAEMETRRSLQAHKEELDILHVRNKKKQKELISQVIAKYHSKFRSGYEKVLVLLKSTDKENLKNMQKHNEILKSIIINFDEFIAKVKSSEVGPKEFKSAELLVQNINELEECIVRDIELYTNERIATEKEAQVRAVEAVPPPVQEAVIEQQQQHVPEPPQQQLPPPPPPPVEEPDSAAKETVKAVPEMNHHQFVHPDRLMFYNRIMEFYTMKLESVKPLQVSF